MAVGATLSSTMTVAFSLAELPCSSVTVRVTVLAPILEQLKSVISVSKLILPQASLELLFTASSEILALPEASS